MRGSTKTNSEYPSGNWITAMAKKGRPKWQTVRAWWDELAGENRERHERVGCENSSFSHFFAFPQTRTGFHTWKRGADGRYLLFSQWDYHLLALIGIRRSNIRKGVLSTNSACYVPAVARGIDQSEPFTPPSAQSLPFSARSAQERGPSLSFKKSHS